MKKLIYGLIITFIVCFSGFLFNVDVAYASEIENINEQEFFLRDCESQTDNDAESTSQIDITAPIVSDEMDMKTYFQNLYEFSPSNIIGTCSYVSLIQYLSYLDTFYNDEIIPEQYDRKKTDAKTVAEALSSSPGVYRLVDDDKIRILKLVPDWYVENNKDEDFQMKLIDDYDNNTSYNEIFAIHMTRYEEAFSGYFQGLGLSFVCNEYNTYSATDDTVIDEEFIKSKLASGVPVLLSLRDVHAQTDEEPGHAVLAYDCDNDGIYANFGWGADDTHCNVYFKDDVNYEIKYVGYFDTTNCVETHSNNYVINGTPYCGCGKSNVVNVSYVDTSGAGFSSSFYQSLPKTYTCKTEGVYIPDPIHSTDPNRIFVGWYKDENCEEGKVVLNNKLIAGWYDSLTLYAKWEQVIVPYEIDLESNSWNGNTYTNGHVTVISPIGTNSSNQMIHVKLKRTEPTGIYNDDGDISNIFRIEIRLSRTATLTADSGSFTSEDNITWIWVGSADSVEISTSITCNVEYLRVDLLY